MKIEDMAEPETSVIKKLPTQGRFHYISQAQKTISMKIEDMAEFSVFLAIITTRSCKDRSNRTRRRT
jgi:hypothetical protein